MIAGTAAALMSLVSLIGLWRCRAVLIWAVIVGIFLGVACGGFSAALTHRQGKAFEGTSGRLYFECIADGSKEVYGSACKVRAHVSGKGSVAVYLRFDAETPHPRYGEVFEAQAVLSAPRTSATERLWSQGITLEARARSVEHLQRNDAMAMVLALRNSSLDTLSSHGQGGALLSALVCGFRSTLDEGLNRDFKVTGLAHVVAVSGAHLSLVSALVLVLLRLLKIPRIPLLIVQALFLLSYIALAAAPPSAIRAAIMACIGMSAMLVKRRQAASSALSVCVIACIALDPFTALSISFALSALATLGIILFSGLAGAWISKLIPHLPHFALEALALTAASGVLTLLFSAGLFSQFSTIAPLANVVVAPLFAPLCAGGLLCLILAAALPIFAPIVVGVACAGTQGFAGVVHALAQIPYASIPVNFPANLALGISFFLACALWLGWPRPSHRLGAGLVGMGGVVILCLFVFLPRLAGNEIVMLDIGQGDAFVIRSAQRAVLIDTGNHDALLREALARHGIYHLDAVIITHGDDDHMGSLTSLAGIVDVHRVLLARDALSCSCAHCTRLVAAAYELVGQEGVGTLSTGDRIRVGAFTLEVIWPDHFTEEGGNGDSLCLEARADVDSDGLSDWNALFVGDAEAKQLQSLIEGGRVGPIDIYKVGHHGSKKAITEDEARFLSPYLALVSCGAHNRYGHPAPSTLLTLNEVGTQIFRSDVQGDVSCVLEPSRIKVKTLR